MHSIIKQITSLRRGNTVYGAAPHKPILLLAVMESFEFGEITDNWIEINAALLTRFYDLWKLLVKTGNTPNFSLPFYHLSHEKGGFWQLIIVPFAQTAYDTIRNGIALSPTFHRAFDNGLIAIDDEYRLLVHPKLKDYNPAAGIRQYENKTILLPKEEQFYPSLKRLAEHRARFGYE